MKHKRFPSKPNSAWKLFTHESQLFISGGADELYLVDEAKQTGLHQLLISAWEQTDLTPVLDIAELASTLDQLANLGAIIPDTPRAQQIYISFLGTPLPALEQLISQKLPVTMTLAQSSDAADLAIVIRTNASWQNSITQYEQLALKNTHIFLDLAYHHTLSIGPYIVPNHTACVCCLGASIAKRWGDTPVPPEPKSTQQIDLIVALVIQLLHDAPKRLHSLIERSQVLDLNTFHTKTTRVFRWNTCPVCFQGQPQTAQPLTLPWIHE